MSVPFQKQQQSVRWHFQWLFPIRPPHESSEHRPRHSFGICQDQEEKWFKFTINTVLNLQQHTSRLYHTATAAQHTNYWWHHFWVAENISNFNIYFPPRPFTIPGTSLIMRWGTVRYQSSSFGFSSFLNIKIISNGTDSEAVPSLPYFKYENKPCSSWPFQWSKSFLHNSVKCIEQK